MYEAADAMAARCIEQGKCPVKVGLNHRFGREDTAVYVRLRGKMDDGIRFLVRNKRIDQRAVADIAVNEPVTFVAIDGREVIEIPRVSELIEIDDAPLGPGDCEPDE